MGHFDNTPSKYMYTCMHISFDMPATACGLFALHVGLIIKLHRGIVRCKKKLSDIDL